MSLAQSLFAADLGFLKVKDGHLADSKEMTLYIFDKDTAEKSNCNGGCAVIWPPLKAPEGVEVKAPFSIFSRADGSRQVAYNKQPLYYYVDDENPGDTNGDGLQDIWHIVPVKPVNEFGQVAIHCTQEKGDWEVFALAKTSLESLNGEKVPLTLQVVKGAGKSRFIGTTSGRLFPDSNHAFHFESTGENGKVVLSAGIVKIDFGNPRVSASLEGVLHNGDDVLNIPKTSLGCRLF